MTTLRMMLKYALSKTIRGEKTTLSYSDLRTLLATMANAVKKRHIAPGTIANNFAPFAGNQIMLGRMPGAAGEHHNDLKEQYFGASKYQRDLLDIWWKQQGFTKLLLDNQRKEARRHANIEVGEVCLLIRDNRVCGTYKLRQVLREKTSMKGQTRTIKMGYEWEEISAGIQRLVLLVPTYVVELLRTPANYDFRLPGACCPRSPLNTYEQGDDAADVLPRRSLRLPETVMKVEDT